MRGLCVSRGLGDVNTGQVLKRAREDGTALGREHGLRAPLGGRFLVIDFLSSAASAAAAAGMMSAGLEGRTQFERSQLPNACGYLAGAFAVIARVRYSERFFSASSMTLCASRLASCAFFSARSAASRILSTFARVLSMASLAR